jgi:hypothetical protein
MSDINLVVKLWQDLFIREHRFLRDAEQKLAVALAEQAMLKDTIDDLRREIYGLIDACDDCHGPDGEPD